MRIRTRKMCTLYGYDVFDVTHSRAFPHLPRHARNYAISHVNEYAALFVIPLLLLIPNSFLGWKPYTLDHCAFISRSSASLHVTAYTI